MREEDTHMAHNTKTTHGVGTDQGGGTKAPLKENGGGGKGAKKASASLGSKKPKTTTK